MEPISNVLFRLYRGTPEESDWVVAFLQGAWPGLVGEQLAKVCRPSAFKRPVLVVEILDRDWEHAVRSSQKELLGRVRTVSGDEVRQLSFVLAPTERNL